MANKKISELNTFTGSFNGTEYLIIQKDESTYNVRFESVASASDQFQTRSFSDISNKPTTLSGYGITDAISLSTLNSFTASNNTRLNNIENVTSSLLSASASLSRYNIDSASFNSNINNNSVVYSQLNYNSGSPQLTFQNYPQIYDLTLMGSASFTASGYQTGSEIRIHIYPGVVSRSIAFPNEWKFIGSKPTTISANKLGILSIYSSNGLSTGVISVWGAEL